MQINDHTMTLKTFLFDDESGVSPVIGVILMVAITVILAAVIATFVLGLGEQISDTAPSATFTYEYNASGNGDLVITHTGGQELASGTVTIQGDIGGDVTWNSDVSAGDSITVTPNNADSTVQVVWNAPNGDQSAILSEW